MDVKTECKVADEHEVKTRTEHTAKWENGVKSEVTDDVYRSNTNIEEIYIKSEPVDTSEFKDELEDTAVANTENREPRKPYCTSSTGDKYNYNTNIINQEIYIKSECGGEGICEIAGQDTDIEKSASSLDESCESKSINKFKQTKTKAIKCNICKKTFSTSYINIHKQVHTGEKPLKCDHCGKAFADPSSLIRHKRIHSGKKPFKCDQCDKAFSQSVYLVSHKRIHSGEKPFKCDQCHKAFTQSVNLITHKRIHSGEKPFKCDQCDKTFTQSANLLFHKRIHSGEKPFNC